MTVFITNSEGAAYLNNRATGGAAYTNAELYLGFTTASPTGTGSFTNEPTSTGSYSRTAIGATGTTKCAAATALVLTNGNGAITVATSGAAWSTGATPLTYWFIATSGSIGAGSMLWYGLLGSSITVNAANLAPSFATSQLSLTLQS
jgi:hypothetical protein